MREAFSLSYLKSQKEKQDNSGKEAKPENVLALREALLSVVKESRPDLVAEIENKQKGPAPEIENKTPERPQQPPKQTQQSVAEQPMLDAKKMRIEAQTSVEEALKSNPKNQEPQIPQKPKAPEVPREILEKMLKMEDEQA
jgi:hypothetical protein